MILANNLSHWQIPGVPFTLECAGEVIEKLRNLTLTADLFHAERGILWGRREGQTTYVTAASRSAREGRYPLTPVGWFQIRLDPVVQLTDEDLVYHHQHFREPGGMALLLKPDEAGAVRVGVFFREMDGGLRGESSYQEVVLPGHRDSLTDERQDQAVYPLVPRIASVPDFRDRETAGWWMPFLTGVLAGAVAFAAIWHVRPNPVIPVRVTSATSLAHAAAPPSGSESPAVNQSFERLTRDLTEQTRELGAELETEKVHNRRLETTLQILRTRLQSKSSTPRSLVNEAKTQRSTPLF